MPNNFLRTLVLIFLLIAVLPIVTGCSNEADHDQAVTRSDFPSYLQDAAPRVAEAYDYAVSHPDALKYQPCYCGCGAMGHTNNLDCFVKDVEPNGEVVYDNHAAGCGICVDIAQDVMRMTDEGKSQLEIRLYVDSYYSQFGPSTDTAMPPA